MKIYQQLRGIAAERGCEAWTTGGIIQKKIQKDAIKGKNCYKTKSFN